MAKLVFRYAHAFLVSILAFPAAASASALYSETLNGNGETRVVITRTFSAEASGKYLLTLKNGNRGPRLVESCYTEDTIEERRQCLFENLTEKIDQDFSRMQNAKIHINGVRVRNPLAPSEATITKARGLLSIPVDLVMGSNQIKIDYLGYSTARLEYKIEPKPEALSAPQAFFLLNRITGTTAQSFNLNARESFSPEGNPLTYTWSWGDEPPETVFEPGLVTATHTYTEPGTYNAKLKVTDTVTSQTNEFSIDLVVKALNPTAPLVNEKPKPMIQYARDHENPLRILIDASQSTDDGEISSYSWRITNQAGQHTTITGPTHYFTFAQPGSYTVRLTVKDNENLAANAERAISVAPLSTLVADEILFSEKSYSGTVALEAVTEEVLNAPVPTLARVRIKNADGLAHPIEDCGQTPWPEKISCLYTNLVNRTYLSLYRVNLVHVYINGRKITDAFSVRKQNAGFETVVALNQVNSMKVVVRGWPTAFATIEIQALEENVAPVAHIAMAGGVMETTFAGTPKTLEFTASGSTDPNDQIMSYRFQAKLHSTSEYTLDSDWQADPIGSLTFMAPGTYDVQASARDKFGAIGTSSMSIVILPNSAPVITLAYFRVETEQAPYRVRAEVRATDIDPGDTLQYNFEFSNGHTTGFQNLRSATTSFPSLGEKSVTITVRDAAGATATSVLPIDLTQNALPIANFTFSPNRAGYAPHTMDFDASGSSDPDGPTESLRYFWDFGDGSPAVEGVTATHTFPAGEWIVTLSVLDSKFGLRSLRRAVFGWTDAPPVPQYVFSRVPNSFQINFDASGSALGNSPIVNYRFEFGDGITENFSSSYFSHTYPAAGVYNTSLRVYDEEGDANITGQTITVFNGQKPTAGFEMTASDVVLPAAFTFDGNLSASPNNGATITHHKWTLPDETVVYGALLYYNTNTHGNFDIKLEVRDSYGFWSDPVTKTFSATSGVLPVAQIAVDKTSIALGQAIHLHGYDSYTLNAMANLVSFEWTMPNGNKLYGPSQTVTLSQTGLKTITLKVTDSKGYVSNVAFVQVNVQARQNPTAVLALTTNGNMTVPVAAHLSAAGSFTPNPGATLTGFEWKISAPTEPMPTEFSLFGPEVDMTFDQVTTWTVALRVFDSAGGTSAWASTTFGPTVNTIPVADINPSGLNDTAPSHLIFNGFGSYDPDGHAIIAWHWLFSDGSDAWGPAPEHAFYEPGTYTATLRVQDEFWAWSDPVTVTFTIHPNQAPLSFLAIEDVPGHRNQKVFKDAGSYDPDGTIGTYAWWISGIEGAVGFGSEFTYTFSSPGTYEVHLDVYDNKGLMGTNSNTVVVEEDHSTIIKARYEVDENDTMKFAFKSSESSDQDGIASYKWLEGTNVLSTEADFTHTFSTEGVHNVTLEIRDTEGALATKAFAVRASETPIAGIQVLSQDTDSVDFFDQPFISDNLDFAISDLPARVRLQPSLMTPKGALTFDWEVGGYSEGSTNALSISVVETHPISMRLVVRDGDSVVARVQGTMMPTAESCRGDEDSEHVVCGVVANPLSGIDIRTHDIVIQTSGAEPILDLITAEVRSIDRTSKIDVLVGTSVSGASIIVDKSQLAFHLLKHGPYEAVFEGLTAEGQITVRVPYFNLSAADVNLPAASGLSLKFVDDVSQRSIAQVASASGEQISLPIGMTAITAVDTSNPDQPRIAFGHWTLEAGSVVNLEVHHAENPDEFGSIDRGFGTQGFAAPQNKMSVQNLGLCESNSLSYPVCPSSGILAGTYSFASGGRGLVWGQEYRETRLLEGGVYLNGMVLYSEKPDSIPWSDFGDQQSPIGSAIPTSKTIECKVFEAGWLRNASINSMISNGNRALVLGSSVRMMWEKLNRANSNYGSLLMRYPSGMPIEEILSYEGLTSQMPFTLDAMSTIPQLRRYYYEMLAAQATYPPQIAAQTSQINSIMSTIHGTPFEFNLWNIHPVWLNYTMSTSRPYIVKATYKGTNGRLGTQTENFMSGMLKGSYSPGPAGHDMTHDTPAVPFNPFEVSSTDSYRFSMEVPAGTKTIELEIAPANRQVERLLYKDDHLHYRVANTFSAACRLADDAYSIRSVVYDTALSNPAPQAMLSNRQIDYLRDMILEPKAILNTLVEAASLLIPNRELRAAAYASRNIFTKKSTIPVDLDTTETETRPNSLWAKFGNSFPQSPNLDHVVKIQVRHPAGESPSGVEVSFVPGGGGVPLILQSSSSVETSGPNLTSYALNMPVSQMIDRVRQAGIVSGVPVELTPKLIIKPKGSFVSLKPEIARTYEPTVFFNGRYTGFVPGSSKRSTYGNNISSFVTYDMTRIMKALDTIGQAQGDFRINDGALPFGDSFSPDHNNHTDGHRLDILSFGVNSYETVLQKNKPKVDTLFGYNGKYRDLAVVLRTSFIAQQKNPQTLGEGELPLESGCSDTPDACAQIATLEKCLFIVTMPEPGSTCEIIHDAIDGGGSVPLAYTMQEVRAAHGRLVQWIERNQEALVALRTAVNGMNPPLKRFKIMYSDGTEPIARAALIHEANRRNGGADSIPTANETNDTADGLSTRWNFDLLFGGLVPAIWTTEIQNNSTLRNTVELRLLKPGGQLIGQRLNLDSELESLFDSDPKSTHFDHFHLSTGEGH